MLTLLGCFAVIQPGLFTWRAGTMTSNGTANGNVDTVKAPPCEDPQRYDGVTRPYTVRAEISPTCLLCHRFLRVA